MSSIQIDAFEVQLGAGILLQLDSPNDGPITILADAGVQASGYPADHVHRKLPAALDGFSPGNRRIDLIVGTHYDADHLRGLVPIIKDTAYEIGEVWLPPVADDEAPNALRAALVEDQFLAVKWSRDGGAEMARTYLAAHLDQCRALREVEREALGAAGDARGLVWSPKSRLERIDRDLDPDINGRSGMAALRAAFEEQLEECSGLPGDESCDCHANAPFGQDVVSAATPIPRSVSAFSAKLFTKRGLYSQRMRWKEDPELASSQSLSFALLRKATARNAITASHLAEVVAALKARAPAVPVKCRVIPNGTPVRLRWSSRFRKFLPGAAAEEGEPVITLLGPSEGLVKKHRDKLPVLQSASLALYARIPIEGITPSNQLSYIFKVEHQEQSILVTGDAGCVDYQSRPGANAPYYPDLLAEFAPLHVIQVAHHGGHNAHFYRVLQQSELTSQGFAPTLILSHATEDVHRPSEAFAQFIGELPSGLSPSLLFTSRPLLERVEGFDQLIHPSVGTIGDVGDIRLSFAGGSWQVDSHAIKI